VQRRPGVMMRSFVALACAAAAVVAVSGCSPGVDYPSIFPAMRDMPPPRPDTTMDAVQVQRATEELVTERNQLSAAAQGAGQGKTANPAAADAAKKPPATAAARPAPTTGQAVAGSAGAPGATGTQTAGAETKP